MTKTIYAIGTMDTKGAELQYLAERLRSAGSEVVTVDVGTLAAPTVAPDIRLQQVLAADSLPKSGDRGEAIAAMAVALRRFLLGELQQGNVAGVIGIGGSGGTALITNAMRALPIGLPKVMVSTVASGNTAPYVDCSDIMMMYSVVDVAGLNVVSRAVLGNAAHAMAGMVAGQAQESTVQLPPDKPTLGMTMFGVTTPCVTAVRERFEAQGYDCLVFHATGTGGRAMEQLVASGMIDGVLDITTTEIADEIVGGVFPAGSGRFDKTLRRQIPLVLSLGAVDMVNFGAIETVPTAFRHRKLHVHNAQVTLMRTNVEENRQIASWIAGKLNTATGAWTIVIPEGGVSALDAPDQPFHDPEANHALFETLRSQLELNERRRVVGSPLHINDPGFAKLLVDEYCQLQQT